MVAIKEGGIEPEAQWFSPRPTVDPPGGTVEAETEQSGKCADSVVFHTP
jgi:hypothetical protein